MGKISGPLLDRIDLHIEVPAVAYQELRGKETGVTSAEMRERVLAGLVPFSRRQSRGLAGSCNVVSARLRERRQDRAA
jgi:magnesium chelatase family protein